MTRKILVITGTRADFGKLKPLMLALESSPEFDLHVFVTGMHTLSRYGFTQEEVRKVGFKRITYYINQVLREPMELILANTISGLSRFVHEHKPDMIIVHGDRIEALAGAIVGAITNTLVSHIEGGERSGTIDEHIRHAVSKLSHIHLVANKEAETRLRQLGENPENIYVIGSPDLDAMFSPELPKLDQVRKRYEIFFEEYGIVLFHPVTTELESLSKNAEDFVSVLLESKKNYVVIYPNNDEGSDKIFDAYKRLENNSRIRILPSLRFEYFLTLLKHAKFIIGNSSAGIREAPAYSVYTINVGTRQDNRFSHESIIDVSYGKKDILEVIDKISTLKTPKSSNYFGDGKSTEHFLEIINKAKTWETSTQKVFYDIN
jgi:UDP-N-acetylglucosamine 2-epimerase (hydrolysing)